MMDIIAILIQQSYYSNPPIGLLPHWLPTCRSSVDAAQTFFVTKKNSKQICQRISTFIKSCMLKEKSFKKFSGFYVNKSQRKYYFNKGSWLQEHLAQ